MHPKVREVVVVGVRSGVEGEELVKAVVVADERCDERELIRYCRERLANYKVPQRSSSGTRSRAARPARCCASTSS